jgi:ligand-binding sensor domain-containing protein
LKRITFLSVFFAFFYFPLKAQYTNVSYDHYDTENGLSNNEVKDILQDEEGFIWIATKGGLNRFDGKDFVKYFSDGSYNHLPSNDVVRIRSLPHHRLVVGTNRGIGILDTHTGLSQQLIIPSADELKINTNWITDLLVDSKNNIIATTYTGVYLFDSLLHLVFRYDAFSIADIGKKRILFGYVLDFLNDRTVIVQGSEKLLLLDLKIKKLEKVDSINDIILNRWNYNPYLLLKLNHKNQAFLVDFSKRIHKLTLNVINFTDSKIANYSMPFSIANEISWKSKLLFLNDSLFAINSSFQNGLYLFKIDSTKTSVELEGNLLTGIQCNWSIVDKDNRLWVGTDKGLYKQSFRKSAFHNFQTPAIGKNSDIDNYVNGFARVSDKLIVSSFSQGLLVYDSNERFIRRINLEKFNAYNLPWDITAYSKDSFLVPTQIGLVLLSHKTDKVKKFWRQGLPVVLDSVAITNTFIDSHHQLWIGLGSGQGVLMMNMESRIWKHFCPAGVNSFPLRYPVSISEDLRGNIWMSGKEGITRWSWDKKIFDTLVKKIAGSLDDISGQWIYSTTDKESNLWICPEDFVLIKWNLQTNQIKVFQKPANFIPFSSAQIFGPWNSQLWIQTNVGLLAFNILSEKFTLLRKTNGLPEDNLIGGRIFYDSTSNRIYAGFNNAFTWFHPDEIFYRNLSAVIYITGIRKMGDTLSYTRKKDFEFSYDNNSINIGYTEINFEDGESNTYAYRLFESKPSPWINVSKEKTLNFVNLKPGDYTFEVKGILSDGTESAQPERIVFTVSPAFYQTWWFYSFWIIVTVCGAYALYRYRINQLLRVQKVRNNISSDLHDDIGAKLTNINILTMLGRQNVQQPELTSSYLNRIADEIQLSGEALDDIVWSINSNNDLLPEVIARMRRYAADIFDNANISFQFNADKQLSSRTLNMEQRRDLFLVYKEAINNIQKHAQASIVDINLTREKKYLCLTVADNGKGFDVVQPTYRNGLKNMCNRVEKWKGRFTILSSPNQGTTITVWLPGK